MKIPLQRLFLASLFAGLLSPIFAGPAVDNTNSNTETATSNDQSDTIYYKRIHTYSLGLDFGFAWQSKFPNNNSEEINPKRGWSLKGTFNRSFKNRFILQLAYALAHSSTHTPADGDYNTYSAMLNGLVTLYKNSASVPYIGAGVGYGKINISAGGSASQPQQLSDSSPWTFAYQFGVGIQEILNQHVMASISYWYMRVKPTLTFNGQTNSGLNSKHTLTLGLAYQF